MLKFEPINLEKQDLYNEYFKVTPEQSADYTFINLFGLKDIYRLEWAFSDDLVWIRQRSPYTLYWAPVGDWNKYDFSKNFPCDISGESILRVPKTLALMWEGENTMKITELRDEWEYVYDLNDLLELKGNKFHKKKNLFNRFIKNDYVYKNIDTSIIPDILKFEEKWEKREKEIQNEEYDESIEAFEKNKIATHEVRAEADVMMIHSLLDNWDNIKDIKGGVLLIDNQIVAYCVACASMRDTLVIHSERGDKEYKGSYQAINKLFLMHNKDDAYKYVNREQDTGDIGLRRAKMSYNPIYFIEKYRCLCLLP